MVPSTQKNALAQSVKEVSEGMDTHRPLVTEAGPWVPQSLVGWQTLLWAPQQQL